MAIYKVRTAKSKFKGSCGHPIESGNRFVVEESWPTFHCADCAKSKVASSLKDLLTELSADPKPLAEGERA